MARAALLALLLALSLPMGAAAAPTGPGAATPDLHEVAVLTLNGSPNAGFATASVDVSTAMAVQRAAADSRLDRYALAERLESSASAEAEAARLSRATTEAEGRITTLRDDARSLRSAYAEGTIDAETYLRRLARLNARAAELRTTLDRLQAHADELPGFSLNGRAQLLESKLIGYGGPVRERALGAATGAAPPTRVSVIGSSNGVALAMLDGNRYVREAYRVDQRTPDSVSSFDLAEAASRAFELYPVAYNQSQQPGFGTNIDGSVGGNLYRVRLTIPTGSIEAYLDDGTRNVFFEVQQRRVDLLEARPSVTAAANGSRLTVNRAYAGGPLEVSVVDEASGEPLEATVVVAGHAVETGPDGTAWTLTPANRFEVTAVGPGGNVTVTVRPLVPTSVTDEG